MLPVQKHFVQDHHRWGKLWKRVLIRLSVERRSDLFESRPLITLFTVCTRRSQTPPIWGAPGGLKRNSHCWLSNLFVISSKFISFNPFFSSQEAPTKSDPQSHLIKRHYPLILFNFVIHSKYLREISHDDFSNEIKSFVNIINVTQTTDDVQSLLYLCNVTEVFFIIRKL